MKMPRELENVVVDDDDKPLFAINATRAEILDFVIKGEVAKLLLKNRDLAIEKLAEHFGRR